MGIYESPTVLGVRILLKRDPEENAYFREEGLEFEGEAWKERATEKLVPWLSQNEHIQSRFQVQTKHTAFSTFDDTMESFVFWKTNPAFVVQEWGIPLKVPSEPTYEDQRS